MTENANEKTFKYQVELVNFAFSPEKGGWLKLDGKMRSGKPIYGTLFDGAAHALHKQLGAIIPPGENVSSMNLVVDLTGRWIERAATKDADGKDKKGGRYFRVHEFDVLSGPRLEVARIGREAARALETSQKVVDLEAAYHVLADFAARMGGVTFDPRASAYLRKTDEHDLDDDNVPASDPEEDAARRYEEQDRVSGLTGAMLDAPEMDAAPSVDAEPVAPDVTEPVQEEAPDFDLDDEKLLEGSIDGAENAPVMEALTLEEDSPLSAEPAVTEEEEPDFSSSDVAENEVEEMSEGVEEVVASSDEEIKADAPSAPSRPAPSAIPARPSAPARPAPPSRVPSRPTVQAVAPGPRR